MPVPSGDKSKWISDKWELEFIQKLDIKKLFLLLNATNYLNVPALFELCCASVASNFKNKDYNKVRKELSKYDLPGFDKSIDNPKYGIKEDEKLMKENDWILKSFNPDN